MYTKGAGVREEVSLRRRADIWPADHCAGWGRVCVCVKVGLLNGLTEGADE